MAITQQMEQTDRNKELVRRANDAMNRGAIDEFGSLLSDDFQEYTPGGQPRDKAACLAEVRELRKAFPDWRYDIQDIIAEGDKVAIIQTFSGTMRGEIGGKKPTGKRMSVKEIAVYRVKSGKLVEAHSEFDPANMWGQLGIME